MSTHKSCKVKYNIALLKEICKRDSCHVNLDVYKNIANREQRIDFLCGRTVCKNEGNKTFRRLHAYGGYCSKCTIQLKSEKTRQTNMQVYGTPNVAQSLQIKEKIKNTNIERYGTACTLQVKDVKDKVKVTFQKKYGSENPFSNVNIKQKIIATNLQKRGVKYPMQSQEVRIKSQNTCISKYGCAYVFQNKSVQQKSKETLKLKYGVDNISQFDKAQEKKIQTNIQKFGYPHPSQNPQVFNNIQRSAFAMKEFVFPDGKSVEVQGYESFAITILLEDNYTRYDIITQKDMMPEIWYAKPNISRLSRYFPDIYISKEKRIIEVKSTYTFDKDKEVNLLKADACRQEGYIFEFWIFDNKGNKFEFDEDLKTYKFNSSVSGDALYDVLMQFEDHTDERVFLSDHLNWLFDEFYTFELNVNVHMQVIKEFATGRKTYEGRRYLQQTIQSFKQNHTHAFIELLEHIQTLLDE